MNQLRSVASMLCADALWRNCRTFQDMIWLLLVLRPSDNLTVMDEPVELVVGGWS
jgi:hypothetical protein